MKPKMGLGGGQSHCLILMKRIFFLHFILMRRPIKLNTVKLLIKALIKKPAIEKIN